MLCQFCGFFKKKILYFFKIAMLVKLKILALE